MYHKREEYTPRRHTYTDHPRTHTQNTESRVCARVRACVCVCVTRASIDARVCQTYTHADVNKNAPTDMHALVRMRCCHGGP